MMLKNKITLLFTLLFFITFFACKTQEKKTPTNTPVSSFIKMQKTPCYGPCPSYNLEILSDGSVTFIGKSFVDYLGTYNSKISEVELENIKTKIEEVQFFELEDNYDSPATDIPSCITEVFLNSKSKKITNRRYGPEELKDLEKLIEQTVLKSNLQKVQE